MKIQLDDSTVVDLGLVVNPQHNGRIQPMKITLDNSPAKLEIVTPHGAIQIEVWPGSQTCVTVKPDENYSNQCLRSDSDDWCQIVFRPR